MLLIISGISGSGKSTLGQIIAKTLQWHYLDMDTFYLLEKPRIKLSSGEEINNWDSLGAIDIKLLRITLEELLEKGNVVFTGFAAHRDIFPKVPTVHVHLVTGDTKEEIIERCVQARKKSKGFIDKKAEKDKLIVDEIVYPFYLHILEQSDITYYIKVYEKDGKRFSTEDLVLQIKNLI